MKKHLLVGFLLLISACMSPSGSQTATPTPKPSPYPTATPFDQTQGKPATTTPEPTAPPEPSPTPLPRFFTQEFDFPLTGWVILQAGNPAPAAVSTEDGTLRLQMDSPYTWLYALYSTQDYADVHIETEFTNSALSPASTGLVCRYSKTDGWLEYNIYTDGTYSVLYGRWLDDGIADYLPILDGTSKEIGQSGVRQRIGLTCSGSTLRLSINGTIIRNVDISRYELPAGKTGLTVSSFENTPVITVLELVTVSEP